MLCVLWNTHLFGAGWSSHGYYIPAHQALPLSPWLLYTCPPSLASIAMVTIYLPTKPCLYRHGYYIPAHQALPLSPWLLYTCPPSLASIAMVTIYLPTKPCLYRHGYYIPAHQALPLSPWLLYTCPPSLASIAMVTIYLPTKPCFFSNGYYACQPSFVSIAMVTIPANQNLPPSAATCYLVARQQQARCGVVVPNLLLVGDACPNRVELRVLYMYLYIHILQSGS